jgi:hypothetical protein
MGMAVYTFELDVPFPDKIENFDRKLRLLLGNVVSWSYSYATKTFTIELSEPLPTDKIASLMEAVKKCL